jgi:hypothetical protein
METGTIACLALAAGTAVVLYRIRWRIRSAWRRASSELGLGFRDAWRPSRLRMAGMVDGFHVMVMGGPGGREPRVMVSHPDLKGMANRDHPLGEHFILRDGNLIQIEHPSGVGLMHANRADSLVGTVRFLVGWGKLLLDR